MTEDDELQAPKRKLPMFGIQKREPTELEKIDARGVEFNRLNNLRNMRESYSITYNISHASHPFATVESQKTIPKHDIKIAEDGLSVLITLAAYVGPKGGGPGNDVTLQIPIAAIKKILVEAEEKEVNESLERRATDLFDRERNK